MNILVIDKNPNIVETFSSLNNEEEFDVSILQEDFNPIKIEKMMSSNQVDVVFFDLNESNSTYCFEQIKSLKNKYKNLSFIAMSGIVSSSLVACSLRNEIDDFLLKPLLLPILRTSLNKILSKKKNDFVSKSKTIGIFSNKGGVGKTTLAINLGYELAQKVKEENGKVCILDLNFGSEDVLTFLNIENKFPASYVIENSEKISENDLISFFNQYENSNIYTFSFGAFKNEKLILKFLQIVKSVFSFVIVDFSSEINELNVSILKKMDLILLMALENLSSLKNIQKCCEIFNQIELRKEKRRLIINRHMENSQIKIQDIEQMLNMQVFHKFPNNYLVLADSINVGRTVEQTNPQSNIAKSYKQLAQEITKIDFLSLIQENNDENIEMFDLIQKRGE